MEYNLNIHLISLHNDQHFQFFVEVGSVVTVFGAAELKIAPLFETFVECFKIEDLALKRIDKSPLTDKIKTADRIRDDTFRGMVFTCRGAALFPDDSVSDPAKALMIVFDTYGNITKKPMSEKISAVMNLVKELRDNYAEAVETVALEAWVDELTACNAQCLLLMQERWDESALQTGTVSMKEARAGVDAAYTAMMKRVLALQEVEGGEIYDRFLSRLSVVIDTFNGAIARRSVHSAKPADPAAPATSAGADADSAH